jgi:hypothetical protein
MHHRLGPLLPANGEEPRFMQIYMLEPADQLRRRMEIFQNLNREIVQALTTVLLQENGLCRWFRMWHHMGVNLRQVHPDVPDVVATMHAPDLAQGHDPRRYNLATQSEVAAFIHDADFNGDYQVRGA